MKKQDTSTGVWSLLNKNEDGVKNKAIIFNNIPGNKIGLFIENLKKFRLNNVLKATVTETSREWTVDVLLRNLVAEKVAMQTGKDFDHEEQGAVAIVDKKIR